MHQTKRVDLLLALLRDLVVDELKLFEFVGKRLDL